jgi:AmiR/NasT family two-component response regulator
MGTAIIDIGWPTEGFADTGTIDAGLLGRSAASVHQAAGMVMVQSDSTIDEAMAQLRASAFAEGRSLITLSAEVVSGHRRVRKEQL